jgi:hypothetical protein
VLGRSSTPGPGSRGRPMMKRNNCGSSPGHVFARPATCAATDHGENARPCAPRHEPETVNTHGKFTRPRPDPGRAITGPELLSETAIPEYRGLNVTRCTDVMAAPNCSTFLRPGFAGGAAAGRGCNLNSRPSGLDCVLASSTVRHAPVKGARCNAHQHTDNFLSRLLTINTQIPDN